MFDKLRDVMRDGGGERLAKIVMRKAGFGYHRGDVQPYWSDYLDWLTFANAGMLVRGNVECIRYALQNLPSRSPILEIGSFCGLSLNVIAHFKRELGLPNPIVSCDPWMFEGSQPGQMLDAKNAVRHEDYREFARDTFTRNVRFFSGSDLPFTVEATSDALFEGWSGRAATTDVFGRSFALGGPIAFAYIDGDHRYGPAGRDFRNCDRWLELGGFILFDDSGDDTEWECRRVAREALASGRYQLVAKIPNYFLKKTAAEPEPGPN
jgi:hypothetical protein